MISGLETQEKSVGLGQRPAVQSYNTSLVAQLSVLNLVFVSRFLDADTTNLS